MLNDSTLKWFDGYDGQPWVIIDDFRSKGVNFAWLLRVTDRYPLDVPVKGTFVRWTPSTIIFTTPHDIATTFADRNSHRPEDIQQLRRRFVEEREFILPGTTFDGSMGQSGRCSPLVEPTECDFYQACKRCGIFDEIRENELCSDCNEIRNK
jgi:hypothetical protein